MDVVDMIGATPNVYETGPVVADPVPRVLGYTLTAAASASDAAL